GLRAALVARRGARRRGSTRARGERKPHLDHRSKEAPMKHLTHLRKRTGPIVAVLLAALVLVPGAASGSYADPAGDSGGAGDITSVTVLCVKGSGALLFKCTVPNLTM